MQQAPDAPPSPTPTPPLAPTTTTIKFRISRKAPNLYIRLLFSQFVMFRCGLSPVDFIHIRSAYAIDTGAEATPGNIG